jgi:1,4-dihydroxy-2-naphthoyl-CoA hydrolase
MEEDVDWAAQVNELPDGWVKANGLVFLRATASEVIAELTIRPAHLQPMGIVHGGVYCALVETTTSIGAGIHVDFTKRLVVGLENHTSFLHASRAGKLTTVARPLSRGNRSQAWEATITNDDGKVAATGRVRVLVIERGAMLGGMGARIRDPE